MVTSLADSLSNICWYAVVRLSLLNILPPVKRSHGWFICDEGFTVTLQSTQILMQPSRLGTGTIGTQSGQLSSELQTFICIIVHSPGWKICEHLLGIKHFKSLHTLLTGNSFDAYSLLTIVQGHYQMRVCLHTPCTLTCVQQQ